MKYLLVVALLAAPTLARADAKSEAQTHIDRATELHQEGKFSEALSELLFAYSLDPRPDLLYAIGQVHVKLGNCEQAITFYERFLTTRPAEGPAAAAREAIEVCKTNPPPIPVPDASPPDVKPPEVTPAIPPEQTPPPPRPATEPAPFYTDTLGDALTGGGVVLGVVSLLVYRSALSDLDASEVAASYDASHELVDSAHGKRTFSIAFAVGGGVLIGAGVARFLLHDRSVEVPAVALVPSDGGGMIAWSGHFR